MTIETSFSARARALPGTTPFVGPETQERQRGGPFAARLGANESVFGPSPAVLQAIADAARDAWMYGDPECRDLRLDIAAHLGVEPENILVGEGVDGLLGLTARLFLDPGDPVATSLGAYPTFNYHVAGFGGEIVTAPYRANAVDLHALAETARRVSAKLVYLSNPDNPTGSLHSAQSIEAFRAALPPSALLCLDEAYLETATPGLEPPLRVSDAHIIRFRTFSKAYGLAGLRIGYAIGAPELIDGFNKIRNHFGVGRLAQSAARAALADQAYLHRVIDAIETSRRRIGEIALAAGLNPLDSSANFVAIDCGSATRAEAIMSALLSAGVFIRKPVAPELAHLIRVSCAPEDALTPFAEALPRIVAAL